MDNICRLCCSTKFVNNYIFDEENALYLKMSLYLPIKVFKNDRLPQKVCDRCSCKVNDFYQFCNETIEVQNRLRTVMISTAVEIEDSIDLTLIKHNDLSPPSLHDLSREHKVEPSSESSTQCAQNIDLGKKGKTNITDLAIPKYDQSTQTDSELIEPPPTEIKIDIPLVRVKQEPKNCDSDSQTAVKNEEDLPADNYFYDTNLPSDNSEDNLSLIQFKKKKRSKKLANGDTGHSSKRKRKKSVKNEWDLLMRSLPEGAALTVLDNEDAKGIQQDLLSGRDVKSEPLDFHCCICFSQCYSRADMLQHYKEHGAASEAQPAPTPPPPPSADPIKCMRCQKRLDKSTWAAHWLRHWERDRRPYRCALCEKSFRDHHQILKHGLTHKWGEDSGPPAGPEKRFVCDVCPEGFVYMRYLLAHRARAHPEAAARALTLRCFVCARSFAHLNSLRRHLRAHSGERNFLCNICGKALSSREHLKFHIRIHTGYKPNVCKTCGKGFVKKCNLTLHERVHSGERPHVCPHCGKAFSQRSTLVIHERYHSGARPYVCSLCNRGFVAKGLLSMHLKTTCI